MTLAIVFKDTRFSFWTTAPVIATVALQWLVMWRMDVSLSLVTVMIGSILVVYCHYQNYQICKQSNCDCHEN